VQACPRTPCRQRQGRSAATRGAGAETRRWDEREEEERNVEAVPVDAAMLVLE
jgi:hypothetical protein